MGNYNVVVYRGGTERGARRGSAPAAGDRGRADRRVSAVSPASLTRESESRVRVTFKVLDSLSPAPWDAVTRASQGAGTGRACLRRRAVSPRRGIPIAGAHTQGHGTGVAHTYLYCATCNTLHRGEARIVCSLTSPITPRPAPAFASPRAQRSAVRAARCRACRAA